MDSGEAGGRTPCSLDGRPDRVVLVTGATGGIGRAIVADLARRGWSVVASDIAAEAQFDDVSGEVRYVRADVTDADQMRRAVSAASDMGVLVGCVANAGVAVEDFSGFLAASPKRWQATMDINVLGTLNTFQAAAAAIAAAGGGRMAATASVAGVCAESDLIAYSASKAAVISIVKSLALELGGANISVNAVAPGPVSTERQLQVVQERDQGEAEAGGDAYGARYERFRNENRPFSRMARPDEVAGCFSWLLSDAAAYITGQVLVLDGGGVLV
jgi:NAD(P)-dependent dehydrogenase (short-subunit alcohol dehydrogenase family)